MAKTEYDPGRVTAGLVVNVAIPGLGTLVRGGAVASGVIQLVGAVLGLLIIGLGNLTTLQFAQLTAVQLLGVLVYLGMWVWALVTGVVVCGKCEL